MALNFSARSARTKHLVLVAAMIAFPIQAQREAREVVVAEYGDAAGGFDSPVRLSNKVLRSLSRERSQASYFREHKEVFIGDFYQGIGICLNPHDRTELDLLVRGTKGPITSGADNIWYWIVIHAESKPRVVLFTTGLNVSLLGSEHAGLRDVKSSWYSPSEQQHKTYHYDGVRYRLVRTKDAPFNPLP
jgi:hypothetical protein